MATVKFTSTNYSAGTCVFTPSDANHSETNLGSITFPFTFNPLAFSLPQDIIEGSFEFTTDGCVFTKTVVRSTPAPTTAATTLATNATAATTLATNATTLATTQATLATTLATNATTLATNATAATTLATSATEAPTTLATNATAATTLATNATELPPGYTSLGDDSNGEAEVGAVFQLRISTQGVREGVLAQFKFEGTSSDAAQYDKHFVRVNEDGSQFKEDPLRVMIDADGNGDIYIQVNQAGVPLEITLDRQDNEGNETGELTHSVKLIERDEDSPVTEATTVKDEEGDGPNTTATTREPEGEPIPTAGTNATTLATNATTLATNATTLATEATTLATEATTVKTEATTIAPIGEKGGEPVETEATTMGTIGTNATTLATEATTLATEATTLATEATTLATEATTTEEAPHGGNYLFTHCMYEGEPGDPSNTIIIDAGEWETEFPGTTPRLATTLYDGEQRICYGYTETTPVKATRALPEFGLDKCVCGAE